MLSKTDQDKVHQGDRLRSEVTEHLQFLYPDHYFEVVEKLILITEEYRDRSARGAQKLWDHKDILLITYGDSLFDKDEKPLSTLYKFLDEHLNNIINCVHILPYFPYSSDDGFSVIDFTKVNPDLGDWEDIEKIATDYKLMTDLVINHISRESLWFYDFVGNIEPECHYFIEMDADTDVSQVTRPRNTPLLVPVSTHRGTRHVWATFSEDQIDLNFSNPAVLLEMVRIFLNYLKHGSKIIRLDAIAFLWKKLGTSCVHLPQTHRVVKLLRTLVDYLYPGTILLTETNVPHKENISYFGQGDEAHMVYQFPLPPLLLHALNRGTSVHIYNWASQLPGLPANTTYLNFTASHDGIGLRALEGIIDPREVDDLLECMHRFGGFVSMKANQNGEDSPYEINISLFDAMQGTRLGPDQWQVPRFLCSQAIMLSLQGIPAVYINSLTATPNDLHGVEVTGRTRSINRKKWQYEELITQLDKTHSPNHEVFNAMKEMMKIRRELSCFHPEAKQVIIDADDAVFAILRRDAESDTRLLALHNLTSAPQAIVINDHYDLLCRIKWRDTFTDTIYSSIQKVIDQTLQPYQVMWLEEVKD